MKSYLKSNQYKTNIIFQFKWDLVSLFGTAYNLRDLRPFCLNVTSMCINLCCWLCQIFNQSQGLIPVQIQGRPVPVAG